MRAKAAKTVAAQQMLRRAEELFARAEVVQKGRAPALRPAPSRARPPHRRPLQVLRLPSKSSRNLAIDRGSRSCLA